MHATYQTAQARIYIVSSKLPRKMLSLPSKQTHPKAKNLTFLRNPCDVWQPLQGQLFKKRTCQDSRLQTASRAPSSLFRIRSLTVWFQKLSICKARFSRNWESETCIAATDMEEKSKHARSVDIHAPVVYGQLTHHGHTCLWTLEVYMVMLCTGQCQTFPWAFYHGRHSHNVFGTTLIRVAERRW